MCTRRMVTRMLLVLWAAAPSAASGQGPPLRLPLTDPDAHSLRVVTVTLKTNPPQIVRPLQITSFDPARSELVLARAGGGELRVAAANLRSITIARQARRPNPVAQMPASTETAQPGPEYAIEIPAAGLRIEAGQLVIADRRLVPAPQGSQVEVNRIDYLPERNRFRITLQPVQYTTSYDVGGRPEPSGPRKGMQ